MYWCIWSMNFKLIFWDRQIFSNRKITLEDILAEKGKTLSRGMTDSDGRIEFWKEDNAAGTRR